MNKTIVILFLLLNYSVFAQPKAYAIFNNKGKSIPYETMIKKLRNADVVFFGELHNNPICHWLQLEMTRDLYTTESDNLVLGAEMFESDNQMLINEYFLGMISERNFEKESRLWPNYTTDYKPLLNFAKNNNLKFVATNVPRRYASTVFKEGLRKLEQLPEYSQNFIAPLPILQDLELNCYKEMLEMNMHGSNSNPEYYPQAQMIKDATMAHFIHQNYRDGEMFIHYNGAFHSNRKEGIVWYLRQMKPDLNIFVISTVEQEQVSKLDVQYKDLADFILVIPERMTKTY